MRRSRPIEEQPCREGGNTEPRRPPASAHDVAGILALQAKAGNAAVTRILRGAGARGVLQRTPGLPVGQLVNVQVEGGARTLRGEIHEVLPEGDYRVRILPPGLPAEVGTIRQFPRGAVEADFGQTTPDLLASQVMNSRFTPEVRARLSGVNRQLAGRYQSVPGFLQVSGTVAAEIAGNLDRGEPPMRPDRGTVGTVTWLTTEGDPHVGIDAGKDHPFHVRALGQFPTLDVISTDGLEALYDEVKREMKDAPEKFLLPDARAALEASLAKPPTDTSLNKLRKNEQTAVKKDRREKAGAAADLTADLTPEEIVLVERLRQQLARQEAAKIKTAKELPAEWKQRREAPEANPEKHKGYIEKRMWLKVSEIAERSPRQAVVVDLAGSRFSKYPTVTYGDISYDGKFRDGRFLLVASRGSMYLEESPPLDEWPPPAVQLGRDRAGLTRRVGDLLARGATPEQLRADLENQAVPPDEAARIVTEVVREARVEGARSALAATDLGAAQEGLELEGVGDEGNAILEEALLRQTASMLESTNAEGRRPRPDDVEKALVAKGVPLDKAQLLIEEVLRSRSRTTTPVAPGSGSGSGSGGSNNNNNNA